MKYSLILEAASSYECGMWSLIRYFAYLSDSWMLILGCQSNLLVNSTVYTFEMKVSNLFILKL